MRISGGTFGHSATTAKPNTGSRCVLAVASAPVWMASMMARVLASLMRLPTPYAPPLQPVFTSQARVPCFLIFSAKSWAYTFGCQTRNGPPKQGENVADGSLTPTSVPATLAVYPLMKWYIACAGDSELTGGSTPNASQVRKTTSVGWPETHGMRALRMKWMGYAPRVFSVMLVSA